MQKWALISALMVLPALGLAQAPDVAAAKTDKAAAQPDPAAPTAAKAPAAEPAKAAAPKPASAASAPKKAAPKKEDGGLLTMMNDGGPMMWIIFFVSLIGLFIFLERGNTLYRGMSLNFKSFKDEIANAAKGGGDQRYLNAVKLTKKGSGHPLCDVAQIALLKASNCRPRKEIETSIEDKMLEKLPILNKRIGLLSFLANSSTLLGLLGTIFGLIAAFAAFGDPNVPAALKQAKLTDGISQAMYTTAAGIVAAVPLLFFHHLLSERQEEIMNEMEAGATNLMTVFEGNNDFVSRETEA